MLKNRSGCEIDVDADGVQVDMQIDADGWIDAKCKLMQLLGYWKLNADADTLSSHGEVMLSQKASMWWVTTLRTWWCEQYAKLGARSLYQWEPWLGPIETRRLWDFRPSNGSLTLVMYEPTRSGCSTAASPFGWYKGTLLFEGQCFSQEHRWCDADTCWIRRRWSPRGDQTETWHHGELMYSKITMDGGV